MVLINKFKQGVSVFAQLSAKWLNEIGARCSCIIGRTPIKVDIPSKVSPDSPIIFSFSPSNVGADESVMPRPSSASSSVPSGQSLKGGWERGVAKSSDNAPSGMRMMVITRIVRTGDYDNFFWAWGYFDQFGMLFKVSPEQGCFSELTKEGWLSS